MSYSEKLLLIDRVINAMVTAQLKEMAEKLNNTQAQVSQLEKQYGKGRAAQSRG